MKGNIGNDTIEGDAGDDQIFGGEGDDIISGGDGVDTIFGNAGNDDVTAGDGADLIYGGVGGDQISGDQGADEIYGGDGSDTIYGGDDDDVITGGAGNDAIVGGLGQDISIYAGNQADYTFEASSDGLRVTVTEVGTGDKDVVRGVETLRFSDGDIMVSHDDALNRLVLTGTTGTDTITIVGSNPVTVVGVDGADIIAGGGGDDLLKGSVGDDDIIGGAGNDAIEGGGGADTIDGGADHDTILGGKGDDVITGGAGDDTIDGGNVLSTYQITYSPDYHHPGTAPADATGLTQVTGESVTFMSSVSAYDYNSTTFVEFGAGLGETVTYREVSEQQTPEGAVWMLVDGGQAVSQENWDWNSATSSFSTHMLARQSDLYHTEPTIGPKTQSTVGLWRSVQITCQFIVIPTTMNTFTMLFCKR